MHYLVTGHTGFKGSWLVMLLSTLGHRVSGIALEPESESLFNQADISRLLEFDYRVDIRNFVALKEAFSAIKPDVVIHLAAQPLVRYSYKQPIETFETNVVGTLNVLESTRSLVDLQATLIITTDKVYRNVSKQSGYVEDDPLGGDDPYSASKAAADIATQSWATSFGISPIAVARAGNVIGGGDWAEDRLIPDIFRSYRESKSPVLRNPESIRPWQHVLDCLNGYLILIDSMIKNSTSGEWNFGPNHLEKHSVSDVIEKFASFSQVSASAWSLDEGENPKESDFLLLDSSKARKELGWKDFLTFDSAVEWTAHWYQNFDAKRAKDLSLAQIKAFLALKSNPEYRTP
jgi:CDP-glucose 4,6-dehydratase